MAIFFWLGFVGGFVCLLVCLQCFGGFFAVFFFVVVSCFFLEGKFLIDFFFFTSLLHLFLFDVSF